MLRTEQGSPTPPTTVASEAATALAWSARLERDSAVLPHHGWARLRRRPFRANRRVVYRRDLDSAGQFPCSGLFIDQRTGASLLLPTEGGEVRSWSEADVILLGAMRSPGQFRFRAFFVTGAPNRRPLATIAVQQRSDPATASPLVAGARVAASLAGRTALVVPAVLDHGTASLGRHGAVADWVVEQALDAHPIALADAATTVTELIDLLAGMWARCGLDHAPLHGHDRDRALRAFAALVEQPPADIWPHDLDPAQTWPRVQDALTERRPLTVGISHGDPGIGNALRLPDGRLALTDWEDAAHRPIAHDVIKALLSAPTAVQSLNTSTPNPLRAAMSAAGAAAWERQLAIALIMFLTGWKNRHARARRRNSLTAHTQRMHRQLHLLTRLLES
ncbi:aminoglycoside phosphotransferase family protein [Jiangella alkaliphila]|uniref:Phosphotransferase enzyme family protein n=1 Tax=Jiangella alkaliphila TaxID=419479 RepID=A0A1H2L9N2_9ACTN|nr:aminoglycoside phosphotransferase family protein [Jiangella alkaliphila]SDU77166.1 hypothetical protein SAMN04488563_5441 [Jiangella alkaliphila]